MAEVFSLLHPLLQQALKVKGYAQPTPIQREAIAPILKGRDVLGCAQTGTGKTAAFCLPLLHRLVQQQVGFRPGRPRVLILAPTRELAAQIGENLQAYAKFLKVPCATVFGGVNINPQVEALKRGVGVLVATPGRLLDLMGQGACELSALLAVVLDEADRMLDMGFLPDIRKILTRLPQWRQSLFFSATMAPEVVALAQSFIRTSPVEIRIDPGVPTVERIAQKVFFVDKENKYALLKWILEDPKCFRVIVFPRMKHGADRLAKQLSRDGFPAMALHGDKSQGARTRALEGFRSGKVQVLVATDIAARGIDVDDVTHVVNYDLPDEAETYVHRIGRTARAGAEGVAYSLVCAHDRNMLREVEAFIGKAIACDTAQPLHSEAARTAMGAAASRPPKSAQGRPAREAKGPGAPRKPGGRKLPPKGEAKRPFYQHVRAKGARGSAGKATF